jgi:hypothetical protein
MMKAKKLWKDRQGALGLAIMAIIAVVILAVAAIVIAGMVTGAFNTDKAPDQDRDGDGKEDPIIGYLKIDAKVILDNRHPFSGIARYIDSVNAELVEDAPDPTQMYGFDLWSHEEELKMKFQVSSPVFGVQDWVAWDQQKVKVTGAIDPIGPAAAHLNMNPDKNLAIRYHGNYQITCTVYEMDGDFVDSKSVTVSL